MQSNKINIIEIRNRNYNFQQKLEVELINYFQKNEKLQKIFEIYSFCAAITDVCFILSNTFFFLWIHTWHFEIFINQFEMYTWHIICGAFTSNDTFIIHRPSWPPHWLEMAVTMTRVYVALENQLLLPLSFKILTFFHFL